MESNQLAAIVMASGHARRFGSNKLLAELDGVPLAARLFQTIPQELFSQISVVARDCTVLGLAEQAGLHPVFNADQSNDTAITIQLGLSSLPPQTMGCMFFVADQPWLSAESIRRLVMNFWANPNKIYALSFEGHRGNPVIFPHILFGELSALDPHEQGRVVLARHPALLHTVEALDAVDLQDVDYPSDLSPNTSKKC